MPLEDDLRNINKLTDSELIKPPRRRTKPSDGVPYLMASDIKEFDVDSQFDITNQRMLAVRDDLTYVVNAKINPLAGQISDVDAKLKQHHDWVGRALEQIAANQRIYQKHTEHLLFALSNKLERRWWKTAWAWIKRQMHRDDRPA